MFSSKKLNKEKRNTQVKKQNMLLLIFLSSSYKRKTETFKDEKKIIQGRS